MSTENETTALVTGGVVMDNWKKERYTREIQNAGFEVTETLEMPADTVLIKVSIPAHRVSEFKKLLQKLEFKYSLKNRHN